MKIYTGYFAQVKQYREAGLFLCGIAQGKWKWGKLDTEIECFKPDWKMVKSGYSEETFRAANLKRLEAKKIVADLNYMSKGRDCILLCYEADPNECHRSFVARWFGENGVRVDEFPIVKAKHPKPEPNKKKQPEATQQNLF